MTATVGRRLARIACSLRVALRVWTGEDDYERYLRRCSDRQEQPLDRGRYFAQRLEERYRSASGCC